MTIQKDGDIMNRNPKERSLLNEKEQVEDFLETLYLLQKKGYSLTRTKICSELNMSRPEYKRLFKLLQEQDCLKPGDGEVLVPTEYGNIRAQEILKKHHYLTDFLQMVCKVEKETAENNACRMEHVISSDVFCGITDYMKSLRNGNKGERIIRGWDTARLYEPGTYEFRMGIYHPEKRNPRVLSHEQKLFCREITMQVKEKGIFYLKPVKSGNMDKYALWYLQEKTWIQADKKDGFFCIPSDIFTYTISEMMPLTEGDAFIAMISNKRRPGDSDIRELNIHLW